MHVLVRLLYDSALRIQDAVGLTFGKILRVQPDEHGDRHFRLDAKKTTSRAISVGESVYDVVKAYQQDIGATDAQVMFAPSAGDVPSMKW